MIVQLCLLTSGREPSGWLVVSGPQWRIVLLVNWHKSVTSVHKDLSNVNWLDDRSHLSAMGWLTLALYGALDLVLLINYTEYRNMGPLFIQTCFHPQVGNPCAHSLCLVNSFKGNTWVPAMRVQTN